MKGKTGGKSFRKVLMELTVLMIFGIAFGYIEGAVAHYLRLHYYPQGFSFPLKPMDISVIIIEMGREAATLVLIACAALLTRPPAARRFAAFVYVFAWWDIVYYLALFVFEKWPRTLLDWDILFMIPFPWFAPVLVPVLISIFGITGAVIVYFLSENRDKIKIGFLTSLLLCGALVIWLFSFTGYLPVGQLPAHYHWGLFLAGAVCALGGLGNLIRVNLHREMLKSIK